MFKTFDQFINEKRETDGLSTFKVILKDGTVLDTIKTLNKKVAWSEVRFKYPDEPVAKVIQVEESIVQEAEELTGLKFKPSDKNDKDKIEDLLEPSDFYAEWDEEMGCFTFEGEFPDQLEQELSDLFAKNSIEGEFFLVESKLNIDSHDSRLKKFIKGVADGNPVNYESFKNGEVILNDGIISLTLKVLDSKKISKYKKYD